MLLIIISIIFFVAAYFFLYFINNNSQIRILQNLDEPNKPYYFTPKRAVQWFDFTGLVNTFKRIALSTDTLSIIDKREVEAAFMTTSSKSISCKKSKSIWIDFMADTGDDFNATTTVFYYLTREFLNFNGIELPRGEALIVGGDLVYPDGSEQNYKDKFKGPVSLIFPDQKQFDEEGAARPILLACPGNHDWYDGLNAFFRLMCQQKKIGAYETIQDRSYFAYRITDNVHLMALDNQLMGDIDIPQVCYFQQYAKNILGKNIHHIILVVAEPYWYNFNVEDDGKRRQRMDSLVYFIKTMKKENSLIKFDLIIAGDLHHYSRYQLTEIPELSPKAEATHFVTSGGGGAFMHMTDFLTNEKSLPTFNAPNTYHQYNLKNCYPSFKDSKNHNYHNFLFAFHNIMFTLINLLSLSVCFHFFCNISNIIQTIISSTVTPFINSFILSKVRPPELSRKENNQYKVGTITLFLISTVIVFLCFKYIQLTNSNLFVQFLLLLILSTIITTIFGSYLFFSFIIAKMHITEASSGFVQKGFKNFLRINITAENIKVYVIGIRKAENWLQYIQKKPDINPSNIQNHLKQGKLIQSLKGWKVTKNQKIEVIDSFTIPLTK